MHTSATPETNNSLCACHEMPRHLSSPTFSRYVPLALTHGCRHVLACSCVAWQCSATTETNDCLCACGGDTPALAFFNVQHVSSQYLPTYVITLCSALTSDLFISDNAVCVRVCVENRRLTTSFILRFLRVFTGRK